MTRLQILFAFLTTLLVSTPALAVYSPELGRFRTRDPAGYVNGSHLTGYVSGNPIRAIDPYGLWKLNFSDDVSPEDRKRIQEAVDTACSRVDDAVDQINGASACAIKRMEEKFGDEWTRTRDKLELLKLECDAKETVINIDVRPHEQEVWPPAGWTEYKRKHDRNSPDDPIYPLEHYITLNNDRDGKRPKLPGEPGNTWHDNPRIGPSKLLLHELFHVIENIMLDDDRDNTNSLDDPMNLERLDHGPGRSRMGFELQQAEACCKQDGQ